MLMQHPSPRPPPLRSAASCPACRFRRASLLAAAALLSARVAAVYGRNRNRSRGEMAIRQRSLPALQSPSLSSRNRSTMRKLDLRPSSSIPSRSMSTMATRASLRELASSSSMPAMVTRLRPSSRNMSMISSRWLDLHPSRHTIHPSRRHMNILAKTRWQLLGLDLHPHSRSNCTMPTLDLDCVGASNGGPVTEWGLASNIDNGVERELGMEEEDKEKNEEEEEEDAEDHVFQDDYLEPLDPLFMTSADLNTNYQLLEELRAAQMSHTLTEKDAAADDDNPTLRTHPLTAMGRFGTSPSTLHLPKDGLVEPMIAQLADISNAHLSDAAHRVFGGIGLPYSTSTPTLAKTMQQKPIALDAAQGTMTDIKADVFLAVLMPGIYASVLSALVETRKRLGTAWAENLVHKAARGELRILDAGGGGAGILAVRELLRAEWERMHESIASGTALAKSDGRLGGPGVTPPLGNATVLTGSDTLRKRASRLLENTTFVPRLPDYLHTEEAKKRGKFDLILAAHTLWPLRENYMRKTHVDNLWSMLSSDGGVLVLLEKGVARGFEAIAAAREMLLDSRIASPGETMRPDRIVGSDERNDADSHIEWESSPEDDGDLQGQWDLSSNRDTKETGAIIAPCTNHSSCPMYKPEGLLKGRRDICHFSQRYHRPAPLQHTLRARDKSFEDVKFSFLAVMRGRDLLQERGVVQDEGATADAFRGFGREEEDNQSEAKEEKAVENEARERDDENTNEARENNDGNVVPSLTAVDLLSLPRAVLPPLKRRGHVIIDLCTPAGTLERWTVPRSFGARAFRDARKASWGDLWALGAKTRVRRVPKVKKRSGGRKENEEEQGEEHGEEGGEDGVDAVENSTVLRDAGARGANGRGRKVKGIRDKRDKKADGRGRRKNVQKEAGED